MLLAFSTELILFENLKINLFAYAREVIGKDSKMDILEGLAGLGRVKNCKIHRMFTNVVDY